MPTTMVMLCMQNVYVVQKIVKDICSNNTPVVHNSFTTPLIKLQSLFILIYSEAFLQKCGLLGDYWS